MSKGFGKRLVSARHSAGLNQAELAQRIGVVRSTVNKWENEPKVEPGARALRRAAKELNTTEEYLLNGQSGDGYRERLSRDIERKLANYRGIFNKLTPKQQREHIWNIELETDRMMDQVKEREEKERRRKSLQAESKEKIQSGESPTRASSKKELYID